MAVEGICDFIPSPVNNQWIDTPVRRFICSRVSVVGSSSPIIIALIFVQLILRRHAISRSDRKWNVSAIRCPTANFICSSSPSERIGLQCSDVSHRGSVFSALFMFPFVRFLAGPSAKYSSFIEIFPRLTFEERTECSRDDIQASFRDSKKVNTTSQGLARTVPRRVLRRKWGRELTKTCGSLGSSGRFDQESSSARRHQLTASRG